MKNNENGSSLLTVLLMLLIFTVLGLVLLSVTIQGSKRTEYRETEVKEEIEHMTSLKEAVAQIKNFVDEHNDQLSSKTTEDAVLGDFLKQMNDAHSDSYTITDVSKQPQYNVGESQTRVLLAKSKKDAFEQLVYITAMPSFMKYAVGSQSNLFINGAASIDGDIYAKNKLFVSQEANYVYNSEKLSVATGLPSLSAASTIFLEDNASSRYRFCASSCYQVNEKTDLPFQLQTSHWQDKSKAIRAFSPDKTPVINKDPFVDLKLKQSFLDKLSLAGVDLSGLSEDSSKEEISRRLSEEISNYPDNNKITSFTEIEKKGPGNYFYEGYTSENGPDAFIDTDSLNIGRDHWLIINGNAKFSNDITINGNVLVTGDIYFEGSHTIDSVMYALGKATFTDTDIRNPATVDPSQPTGFIMMAMEGLQLAIYDKFASSSKNNTINGFLYTDSSADIYGVGSLVRVNGSIFAKQNLSINAYQGEASGEKERISFTPSSLETASRLKVKNNKRLFIGKSNALPKVTKFDVITDNIIKNN
ncbi:hypothetical protein [Bacillus testis]|uniref:hypothetical protein n=1 Tax=Bacillus testis TaxID=1622072 RepID=UPI00067E66D3|nr:hypothetical protein [Bacillus testis]